MNFRSSSSKVATFQIQSSTRSALPQLQLTSRKLRMRRPVGLLSGNWRGGPSTFANLSRILRQTFAKIQLEVALSLPRQLQTSQKLVSAGWGLLLQRRTLAATLRLRILRPTLVCGHSARTAGKYISFITPASCLQATQNFRGKQINFRDPLRGTFAKVNAKTKRSSPS